MNYSRVILKHFDLFRQFLFTAYQITAFNMRKRISLQIKMIKGGMTCNNHPLVGDNECL